MRVNAALDFAELEEEVAAPCIPRAVDPSCGLSSKEARMSRRFRAAQKPFRAECNRKRRNKRLR